ncbi:MAG: hypothetical protein L6Q54_09350 [Leptospiraceae bacterium]|nr:hypothetical protein [Leptospiraceae bacterium]MCK6381434.1 hypothetical protein [Leptospiraceae bacterium]NUM41253.1 hypothetical protein [Leptospiraceae bacterium]
MTFDELKTRLSSKSLDTDNLYKNTISNFAELGFFSPLNGAGFYEFHKNLFRLATLPHGVGLSLSIMSQVNVAGYILKIAKEEGDTLSKKILHEVVLGEKIVSFGVSEKNWNFKLRDLKSRIELKENNFILNAEKSFLTNGLHSDYYLLVVNSVSENKARVVCVDQNKIGLQKKKFSLPFAMEATHVQLKCEEVTILSEEILNFDYRKYAEILRFSEILSISAIFCGWIHSLLSLVKENKNIDWTKVEETTQKKILKIKVFGELLFQRVLDISKRKDENSEYNVKEDYPFGLEDMADTILPELKYVCGLAKIQDELQKEIGLFLWRDSFHKHNEKKAFLKWLHE